MAYANGARSMTHVYNGMTPFNHRANGLVGAAYRIRLSLIHIYRIRTPNYCFKGEQHNFFELTYVDEGELETEVEDVYKRQLCNSPFFTSAAYPVRHKWT